MTTLNDHAQESESRFSCLSAANPENIPDVRKGKIKSQYTTKARKSNKPWPPALRAGGHSLFDFCVCVVFWYFILYFSWRQGCFRDPRRSSMRICFQTLAHDRPGLSLHSSDMVYVSNWRSWRLQARCTIPLFFFLCIYIQESSLHASRMLVPSEF